MLQDVRRLCGNCELLQTGSFWENEPVLGLKVDGKRAACPTILGNIARLWVRKMGETPVQRSMVGRHPNSAEAKMAGRCLRRGSIALCVARRAAMCAVLFVTNQS